VDNIKTGSGKKKHLDGVANINLAQDKGAVM
jgi:hypothetical protein